jgi:hypothetical protein
MRHEAKPARAHQAEQRNAFRGRDLQARIAPCAVLLLEAGGPLLRRGEMKGIAYLEPAVDPQPPQRRNVFLSAAARCLIDMAGVAHAVVLHQPVKVGFGLEQDDTGRARGLPLRDSALLEQRDIYSRSSKGVCGGASNRTPADNGDVSAERSAVPRIGGPPRSGKPVGPIDGPITRFGQARPFYRRRRS